MHAADYAPPGFFEQHLLVPGFQLRVRVIAREMDLHVGELMAAYKCEARPHVRNEVAKDGLNICVQACILGISRHETHCAHAHCPHESQLAPQRAAAAAVGSCVHSTATRPSKLVPVQF